MGRRAAAGVLVVTVLVNIVILVLGGSRRPTYLIVGNILSSGLLAITYLRRSPGLREEDDVTTLNLTQRR